MKTSEENKSEAHLALEKTKQNSINQIEFSADEIIDCELTWSERDDMVNLALRLKGESREHRKGQVSLRLGFREYFTPEVTAVLKRRSLLNKRTAIIGLKNKISNIAANWYKHLGHTNYDEYLVVLYHEFCTHGIASPTARFGIMSVLWKGSVLYCTTDEFPVVDCEQGENQRRLKSIIENGEP